MGSSLDGSRRSWRRPAGWLVLVAAAALVVGTTSAGAGTQTGNAPAANGHTYVNAMKTHKADKGDKNL